MFQGEATTTEIQQNRDGTISNGKSSTDATFKVKDSAFKVAAIIGVELKVDAEKLAKAITDFFKMD